MSPKTKAISLILCLLLPVAMAFFALKYQKDQVRREVKWKLLYSLDVRDLALITVHKKDKSSLLEWEHSKEFVLKGCSYDIVRTTETADSISYWCYADLEESAINSKIDRLLCSALQGDSQSNESEKRVIMFFKSMFLNAESNLQFRTVQDLNYATQTDSRFYISRSIIPPVPPPWFDQAVL